jgi:hypothetical protein
MAQQMAIFSLKNQKNNRIKHNKRGRTVLQFFDDFFHDNGNMLICFETGIIDCCFKNMWIRQIDCFLKSFEPLVTFLFAVCREDNSPFLL